MSDSNARPKGPVIELGSDSLHELVSPANQIGSMVDLILRRHAATFDEETATLFEFIQTASRRQQEQLAGISEFLRVAELNDFVEECSADRALNAVLTSFRPSIEKHGIRVTCDPLPALRGNTRQIEKLFQVLIDNAIKFRAPVNPEIHIGGEAEGNTRTVWVRDNGIGIEPTHRQRIFHAFKRVRNDYPGSGIGLAIAEHIVARHGGSIRLESEPGAGSTFTVTLPHTFENSRCF